MRAPNVRRLVLTFWTAVGLTAVGTGAVMVPGASALPGMTTGFTDWQAVVWGSPSSTAPWQRRAASEGASLVRANIYWSQIAPRQRPAGFVASDPASPGYDWSVVDQAVRDLTSHGLSPILVAYIAPSWAQDGTPPPGVRQGTWKPDPTQFGDFGRAMAIRYSGHFPDPLHPGHFLPHVSHYQAWNEPNFSYNISPAFKKTTANPPPCHAGARTCPGWAPESPSIYRPMLNAFYSAIKGVNPSDVVLSGGTAPYGDAGPVGSNPKLWRVHPLAFYRELFCLNQKLKEMCGATVHLDAVDNHAYTFGPPTQRPYFSDDLNISDMYKLYDVVRAAERAGTLLPSGHKQIWNGEMSFASNPPRPNKIAVSPARQAAYLEESMYLLWHQHVTTMIWLGIVDKSSSIKRYNPFNYGGLYFNSGAPKPAATAFRFPFVTNRVSSKRVQAWGRAPSAGTLRIERKAGGKWQTVAHFGAKRHQVFLKTLSAHGRAKFRAQIGSQTSLVWIQSG